MENNNMDNQISNNNQSLNNQQFMNQTFQQGGIDQAQQPIHNQYFNNNQNNMPQQVPINYNSNQPPKTSKKKKFIILGIIGGVLLVLAFIFVPLIAGINNSVKFRANKSVENLYLYIPKNWNSTKSNQYQSESGLCEITAGKLLIDYNEAYSSFQAMYGAKFVKKTLNKQDWDHLNVENGNRAINLYMIDSNYGNYSIIFYRKSTTDEECNEYLEKLENSIELREKTQ